MKNKSSVSKQTQENWMIDITLFISAVLASISGIYFLYLPIGGYQGGRNPYYGIRILFERHTWSEIHIWTGVLMIVVVLVHVPIHWDWIVNMTKRMVRQLMGKDTNLNVRSRFNVFINVLVGLSFIIVAVTGVYLLFVPGVPKGVVSDPMILFSRTTWDLIHSWSGVVVILAGLVHFAIHWKWVVKVTRKVLKFERSIQTETVRTPELS
ncbi:MAG: DUF4405 domain-containing protein [Anaerolineales bacterium]|nr:DUF4405 domain-containing protein [Anaerolineales bacterium]